MAFKYRQKKTLRRKRRFLKRKGAKTYRRSLTKRRSMRGGEETIWPVDVFLQATADDRRKEGENEEDYNTRIKNLTLELVLGYEFKFDPNLQQDSIKKGKLYRTGSDTIHDSNVRFKVIDGNYYPSSQYSMYIIAGIRRGILSHFRKHPVDESWENKFDTNPDEFIKGYMPKK